MSAVVLVALLAGFLASGPSAAERLRDTLGRSESQVRSAAFVIPAGRTVWEIALAERLDALGYVRRHQRPERPGEYFWGHDVFWIFRRAHRWLGDDVPALRFGLDLGGDGRIRAGRLDDGSAVSLDEGSLWLEPVVLADSLAGDRAVREPIDLDGLPERVWRPVLAAEDGRFFEHSGLDARSLARALLANLKAGSVKEGGSTITQQLIKNRDLTPKRTLGRKASEAVRAVALEAEVDKREILEAYLDRVYLGHADGLAIHGFGAAARVYFSKGAAELDLAEAAMLAAMIQGPNRLAPERHPEAVKERRDWVLGRMEELGWASPSEVAAARRRPLGLRPSPPRRPPAPAFLRWVAALAAEEAPGRIEDGRGVVAETGLDPMLQAWAEDAVRDGLRELRRRSSGLRRVPLSAALVALDAVDGTVLAWVGGDPDDPADAFDRARQARRQPGSTVKPLLLLEAFERCGRHRPVYPAARISDSPLTLDLPSGPWSPTDSDRRFRGTVTVRDALRDSLNVPFVRLARWCGFAATAGRLRDAGLELPDEPPPSFALGAVEVSPLELAAAYTLFAGDGRAAEPRPLVRLERPGGRKLEKFSPKRHKVASAATVFLIRDLLLEAAREGTARSAQLEGLEAAAKTGTSSERRDAWLAGQAGRVVAVVWVGRDDDQALGLTGSSAAAPIWKRFMERAVPARPPWRIERPEDIVELWVDAKTGLLVRSSNPRAHRELFRRGATPRRDRFWRIDRAVAVIE